MAQLLNLNRVKELKQGVYPVPLLTDGFLETNLLNDYGELINEVVANLSTEGHFKQCALLVSPEFNPVIGTDEFGRTIIIFEKVST